MVETVVMSPGVVCADSVVDVAFVPFKQRVIFAGHTLSISSE
jgi:hypothetical protein